MRVLWALMLILCVVIPFVGSDASTNAGAPKEASWPLEFEGRRIERIGLSKKEKAFASGFPGAIERFSDGEREIIMRKVDRATRKLHPSGDCLKGAGFTVAPVASKKDASNRIWGCVEAKDKSVALLVCEMITDGRGNSWSDVSSWYWGALLGGTTGPWTAVTVAERRRI